MCSHLISLQIICSIPLSFLGYKQRSASSAIKCYSSDGLKFGFRFSFPLNFRIGVRKPQGQPGTRDTNLLLSQSLSHKLSQESQPELAAGSAGTLDMWAMGSRYDMQRALVCTLVGRNVHSTFISQYFHKSELPSLQACKHASAQIMLGIRKELLWASACN